MSTAYLDGLDVATLRDALGVTGPGKCRCPVCGGRNLTLNVGQRVSVLFHCFNGCSKEEVVAEIARELKTGRLGVVSLGRDRPKAVAGRTPTPGEKRARARRIWKAARRDTSEVPYFQSARKIRRTPSCARLLTSGAAARLNDNPEFGAWLPMLPHLVFKVEDVAGRFLACHTILLTRDMTDKAAARTVRKTWGSPAGGFVLLGRIDPDRPLLIGEGVETVAAAMQLKRAPAGLATIGTEFLEAVRPPEAREYVICGDYDRRNPVTGFRPGRKAALALADRLVREGRTVRVAIPKPPNGVEKYDWNDVLKAMEGL